MMKSRKPLERLRLAVLALALPLLATSVSGQSTLKNGLVAYWPFEGNFTDEAGIFDGTENGSAPIAFVNGKPGFGKAIEMDGSDQFVEITGGEPDDLAFEGASMSVGGWFKVTTFDTSWQALIAKGEGNNWRIHRRGAESGFAHAGGTGEGPAGGAVDDGAWHHFMAISDVEAANFGTALYIDGVKYTENASVPNLAVNGKRVMIGENPDARGREWAGLVDDIAIWNRVVTETEIGQLFANGVGKPLSVLLGATVTDTDKDGMPDDYEKEKGFNPNDPSDAAKDFDGDGVSNLDEFKAGTDPIDKTKPTIVSAASSPSFTTITLNFSEDLDPTTVVAANFTIAPALDVTAAAYAKKTVTLTTAAQTPGGTAYTVTVKGVKDTSKNEVAASTKAVVYSYLLTKNGGLRILVWENISGTPVDNLYNDERYPASPTRTGAVFSFNSRDYLPTDSLENYGAVIEGFITPTESGNYRFFIYSDDASQLLLSTDDKEANLVQIAEETGCCNNFTEPDSPRTSEPIALVAGKKYFIRLVYKEGGGGDYGQVAWRKEGDKTPAGSLRPIPSAFLSSAVDLAAPAEGAFVTQSPAPGAKKVSPAPTVTIVHRDGKTEWTAANVTLKFDGDTVTPTFEKVGNVATITYTPPGLLPSGTSHRITLGYRNPANATTSLEWSFQTAVYGGPVKDTVKGYSGLVLGSAKQTDDKGGHSGAAGDRAMDLTTKGGPIQVLDPAFLAAVNQETASDELSVSLWIKKYDIADSSAFWFSSPSQARVFQAHTPWSDSNIYFDTAGCCDAATQRINANIDTLNGYSGDASWWQQWRLYVFTKKGDQKNIYVDGQLFLNGSNTGPLSTDINQFMIGSDNAGGGLMHALVDDVSVWGKELTPANITALKGGTKPAGIAGAELIANWDFDAVAPSATESLKNGIVAYWPFDGNLQDQIKDFHGTGRGANPIVYTAGKDGFGQAIDLDGADQFVEITGGNENELEFPGGSMSISGWFRVDAFDTEWQALIAKGEGSNYRVARRAATGTVAYAGGVGEGADNIGAVNDGQWHHFVAVSDATGVPFGSAMYIDGVLLGINTTKAVLTANDKHLFIGENPEALNRQWNGGIDDIAIWNRVLTATEVAAIYNGGTGLALSSIPGLNQPPATLSLSIARSGGNISIQYSKGTLQSADTVTGTFTDVAGATSPYSTSSSAAARYFRLRQ